ncbi:chloride channel protein [Marinomonas spartinae]|uniref:chloride channel protein n=1 Tax=Marinomonas spartinae TaxID=1792290 RepID=UPI001F46BA1C|nr:chloride channel protein [Marinomonas spartinae]
MLSWLGAVCGILSGLLMVLLYWLVQWPAEHFMFGGGDGFAALTDWQRALLPIISCFLLVVFFIWLPAKYHKLGIPYVIERLNYHQGVLPVVNGVVQFFSVAIALAGGLSIGKEGPAVHIGATFGSLLAQRNRLPQFGVETLLACGVSGAIAASFQTPLGGVLFAFEVIFLEYRVQYVLPVLLSSVAGMLVSQYFLGALSVFRVNNFSATLLNLDLLLACLTLVLSIVVLALLFNRVQKILWPLSRLPIWTRFSLVAMVTSLAAYYLPDILGGGYDPLVKVLSGETLMYSLLVFLVAKTLLTSFTIGLGIPGGMIGPTLIIGGVAGVQVAFVFGEGMGIHHELALFALLGMAGMMAACFQAPLTALITVVEMTHSSEAIVPALFVIVLACLIMRLIFQEESVFVSRLHFAGLSHTLNPFKHHLMLHSVQPVSEEVVVLPAYASPEEVKDLGASTLDFAAFRVDDNWRIARRAHMLEALEALNQGPQPWLVADGDHILMNLLEAVESTSIDEIEDPDSLASVADWFHQTQASDVLVVFSKSHQVSVISRRTMDQFLFKDR